MLFPLRCSLRVEWWTIASAILAAAAVQEESTESPGTVATQRFTQLMIGADGVATEPAKSTRERAVERRQAKLDQVREQVENGTLVIRQMTEEERLRYPPVVNSRKAGRTPR